MYRILFTEADRAITRFVRQYPLWKNSEFQISKAAASKKEAFEFIQQETFDLMIADIQMLTMDGLELIRRMQRRDCVIPILLASSYMDFKYAKAGIRLGVLDFIEKPYSEKKLAEALDFAAGKIREQQQVHEFYPDLYACISRGKLEDIAVKLLDLDEKAADEMVSLGCKLKLQYPEEPEKAALLLKTALEELWHRIIGEYEWVAALETPKLEIRRESYEGDFYQSFTELTGIIEKYALDRQDVQTNRICRVLALNRGDPAVTDILETEMKLTKDYISRIFRARIGVPISQYITMLRMEWAKNQLTVTDKKVYEISIMLGYQTTDYFTRLFKSCTGYTPMQYRKLSRQQIFNG